MTQKEAIIEALKQLGGKAKMCEICKRAIGIGDFSGSKNPGNTVRNCIYTNPHEFRPSGGGWWELVSYQEEIAELKTQIAELAETNKQLMAIPKEAEFVDKFLKEVMNDYKRNRGAAEPIRNILRHMGHEDAAAVLDAWIDEKEDELVKALLEKIKIQIRNINMTGQNATYNEKK